MGSKKFITKLITTIVLVVMTVYLVTHFLTELYFLTTIGVLQIFATLTLVSLMIVLTVFVRKQITTPISRLIQASRDMEKGIHHWVGVAYLSKSISLHHRDEVGELASSFNHMVKVLGEKEKIRSILGKVISDDIAKELVSKKIRLEGEEKNASILFVDICDFTYLSETMKPTDVLSMLNTSFTKITEIIEQHHGIVDKYIGDAVMALFGVPIESDNHSSNALLAALEIVDSLDTINNTLKEHGLPEINIGIGINSGIVVAGNIGSETRMNYTVIGDSVNLASRLQNLNRQYGTQIIVGEATKIATPQIEYRLIGQVEIKGRVEEVSIYEPLRIK